jgi:hypothetical protein
VLGVQTLENYQFGTVVATTNRIKPLHINVPNKRKLTSLEWPAIVIVVVILGLGFTVLVKERNLIYDEVVRVVQKLQTSPEQLYFNIKQLEFGLIEKDRNQAVADFNANIDLSSQHRRRQTKINSWAKGNVVWEDNESKARIKLKGSWIDHWRHPTKWSLHIKLLSDNLYKGFKSFSIHVPETRNFTLEWVYIKALEREGLIPIETFPVEVFINGDSRGIYLLQERASKLLLERNSRREGPIVRMDKKGWVLRRTTNPRGYSEARINSPDAPAVFKDPIQNELFQVASIRLDKFRKGVLPTTEVFDGESLAKVMALRAALGGSSFDWRDIDFYVNPVTNLLEPIGKELVFKQSTLENLWWLNDETELRTPFLKSIFSDEAFLSLFYQYLNKYTQAEFFDTFYNSIQGELDKLISIYKREYTFVVDERAKIERVQRKIQEILSHNQQINAWIVSADKQEITIKIQSEGYFPLQVTRLFHAKSVLSALNQSVRFGPRSLTQKVQHEVVFKTTVDGDIDLTQLQIEFQTIGSDKSELVRVHPSSKIEPEQVTRLKPGDDQLFQKYFNIQANELVCKQGALQIDEPVIIPAHYSLRCTAPLGIVFRGNGQIISKGKIELRGTKESPVFVEGTNDQSTLVVIQASGRSVFENVVFSGMSAVNRLGWHLPGAITLYESDITIKNTVFKSNRSGDDSLNIIRSKVAISDTQFLDARADALDLDFVTGKIERATFTQSGNDALDVSGSTLHLSNITVDQAGDKGISVGEKSTVDMKQVSITDTNIAVASKDLSQVTIENIKIANSVIGLAAYQKKPEFGPGKITLYTTPQYENVGAPQDLDTNSTITLNHSS